MLLFSITLTLLKHFNVPIDFINLGLLLCYFSCTFFPHNLKRLLIILHSINFSAILAFKVKEILNNFFRLFEWHFFVTIRITSIKIDIRSIKLVFFFKICLLFTLGCTWLSIFSKFFSCFRSFSFL